MGPVLLCLALVCVTLLALALLSWRRPRLGLPLLGLALGLAVWGFWIEPRSLVVARHTFTVEGLAAPVRAVAIGDIQPTSLHLPIDRIEAVIARAAAEKPDIALWLGDYAYDGGITRLIPSLRVDPARIVEAMAALDPPMGAWAVLGNHDWWWDGPEMQRLLGQAHIRLLTDQAALAEHPDSGASLIIAGLDDLSSDRPTDPERTLADVPEASEAPVIVISHSPDAFPLLPQGVALALAGHTHCGQVNLPLIGPLIVPVEHRRFACGLVEEDGRRHLITSGLGTAIVPVRFRAPPEILVIDLVPG